ncbi:endonuclease/exonuclease/phosphatase family protein [Allorhizobium sp. BGMRC 0089]|uniref:endonuclease/exonuclease/phosphatase family protein n=1 Tax=Allorhizobium sonneratiae TaxID=2934936 RepID=UPI00203394AB|nr:endonuclease/exonuclease/phosphatase family protein [Allorhizobium sonneratiae]MCM2294228.1 endonuclease/exonuclease/phosphatase family protein [Allorhizobium sonneratiae]
MTQPKPNLRTQLLTSLRNRRSQPVLSAVETPHSGLLVASYNVHKCVGADGRFDPDRVMEVICEIGPDVIALQEADKRFGDKVGLLDMARLARETGLTRMPLAGRPQSHGWRGNVLLFREGVMRNVHPVVLPGLEPRGAVVAEIDLSDGSELRIIAAHLGLLRWARRQQADFILRLMREREDCPTVLMGDFNEWRLGERSALSRFEPVFGPLPPPVPSFPARLPLLALDRIMANRAGLIRDVQVHDSPVARLASDHLPLKAWIDLAALSSHPAILR